VRRLRATDLPILGWLHDGALEQQLLRCAESAGVVVELCAQPQDLQERLARLEEGVVIVRGSGMKAAVQESLEVWLRGAPQGGDPASRRGARMQGGQGTQGEERLGGEAEAGAVGPPPEPAMRGLVLLGAGRGRREPGKGLRLMLPARPTDAALCAALDVLLTVSRTVAQARRHAERLSSTLELTRQLAACHDFREMLYDAARHIAMVVHVERASILLVDPPSGEARVVATSDDPQMHDLRLELERYPEIRDVLARREPVYVADVSTDPRLAEARRLFGTPQARASYLFPIVGAGVVLGVLALKTKVRGRLEEEQVSACQAVATACSPALENAREVRNLERQAWGIRQQRMEAERQVHALSKYAQFFESAADGLIVIDLQGDVLYANPSARRLVGGAAAEVPRRLVQAFDDAGRGRFGELLAGFVAGRFPIADFVLIRGDGTRRTVQISSSPVAQGDGAYLMSVRDVTDDRAMAMELERTKTFLERVVDSSLDGVVAADMKGKIILFNRGAERITGWRGPEVLGRMHIRDFYGSAEQARDVMARLRSEDCGGVGRLTQTRVQVRSRDGESIPVSVSAAIIYEGEREVATCGLFTDLRERMRIEERLAQTQEKLLLTEKQAIVSEVSGAMAHELNQPLTSVLGYAELLRKTLGEDARGLRYVETILQETERMAEIVKKIGRLTKYETTRYVGSAQILDLDRSTDETK
jgi:PAS domain S-box-containing protein